MKDIEIQVIKHIRENNYKGIMDCVKNGLDISFENDMVLDLATGHNNLKVLKFLTDTYGLQPEKNFRCLRDAATHENFEMLDYLIFERKTPLEIYGNTPLNYAVLNDKLNVLKYFEKNGANLFYEEEIDGKKIIQILRSSLQVDVETKCFNYLIEKKEMKKRFLDDNMEEHIFKNFYVLGKNLSAALGFLFKNDKVKYLKLKNRVKEEKTFNTLRFPKEELEMFFLKIEIEASIDVCETKPKTKKI